MTLAGQFAAVDRVLHDLSAFDCGKLDMNRFLARFAVKNTGLGLSRTWVLAEEGAEGGGKAAVVAYFTLAGSTVESIEVPTETRLPRYPVPVVLLARLAVDRRYQGRGLGGKTLVTALRKSVALTDVGLNAFGIVLDVLDEDARRFYQRYELFEPFTDSPMRLFLPMGVARRI